MVKKKRRNSLDPQKDEDCTKKDNGGANSIPRRQGKTKQDDDTTTTRDDTTLLNSPPVQQDASPAKSSSTLRSAKKSSKKKKAKTAIASSSPNASSEGVKPSDSETTSQQQEANGKEKQNESTLKTPKSNQESTPKSASRKTKKREYSSEKKREYTSFKKKRKQHPSLLVSSSLPKKKKKRIIKNPTFQAIVHRMQDCGYIPKPIVSMASHGSLLTCARQDGSVELKHAGEKFRTLARIAGQATRPVDCMTFVSNNNNKCIGGSVDGTLFVVDFQQGLLRNVMASGGGSVTCLASVSLLLHPSFASNKSQEQNCIAAGCEDGSIRIFELDVDDRLQFVSNINTGSDASILSLAWTRKTPDSTTTTGSTLLYAGLADGTIRHWISTSSSNQGSVTWKSSWRITVESLGRTISTRVWSLIVLNHGSTLVSGDDLGHVQFWSCCGSSSQIPTLQATCDQSDLQTAVTCLVASPDQQTIFASGVDSRVVCIQNSGREDDWILTHAQRPHTHDVNSLAIVEQDDSKFKLCSGGVDTKLCIYSAIPKEFSKLRPKNLYPWPNHTPIVVAQQARNLAMRQPHMIEFHPLAPKPESTTILKKRIVPETTEESTCLEIQSQACYNLSCHDVSSDGSLLAVSNAMDGLLLFHQIMQNHDDNDDASLSSSSSWNPVPIPTSKRVGPCVALCFISKTKLACATCTGFVAILDLVVADNGTVQIQNVQSIELPPPSTQQQVVFGIHTLCSSADGKWLVSCQNGTDGGAIHVFSLKDTTIKHWWTLGKPDSSPTTANFIDHQSLVVACVDFGLYIYNVSQKCTSPWSQQMGHPVTAKLPTELVNRNDYPVRIAVDQTDPNKLILGSFGSFCTIDLSKPPPAHCQMVPTRHVRAGHYYRRRNKKPALGLVHGVGETNTADDDDDKNESTEKTNTNYTICLRYNSMIYMDFVGQGEMMVVEQPWLSVVGTFPDPLERKVYGT